MIHDADDILDEAKETQLTFTVKQALALWKFLQHEHIPYEEDELLAAVRKLSRFVDKVSE